MRPTYDIFRRIGNDTPLWIESVEGLEEARERVRILAKIKPGFYLIWDSRDGRFIESCRKSA